MFGAKIQQFSIHISMKILIFGEIVICAKIEQLAFSTSRKFSFIM